METGSSAITEREKRLVTVPIMVKKVYKSISGTIDRSSRKSKQETHGQYAPQADSTSD